MPYKNKEDRNAHHRMRTATDPEFRDKHNTQGKEWAGKNPEKVKEKNRRIYNGYSEEKLKERAAGSALWRTLNPGKTEEFNEQRKIRVLSYYGRNGTLQCCGENCVVCDPDMLSIDHIENDGAKDRKTRGTGNSLYLALEKEGYPAGFQTLCHNHQWKKEILRRKELRTQKAEAKFASLKSLESTLI